MSLIISVAKSSSEWLLKSLAFAGVSIDPLLWQPAAGKIAEFLIYFCHYPANLGIQHQFLVIQRSMYQVVKRLAHGPVGLEQISFLGSETCLAFLGMLP